MDPKATKMRHPGYGRDYKSSPPIESPANVRHKRWFALRVGDRVRSHYKARWTGEVLEKITYRCDGTLVRVRVTHNRNGRRVSYVKELSVYWLEILRES